MADNNRLEENITVSSNYTLPENGMMLAEYSALIHFYDLAVPLPELISAISEKHRSYTEGKWRMFKTGR